MNETLLLMIAFACGLFAGTCFFGGLWWSVKRSLLSTEPRMLLFKSFVLRCIIVITLFQFAAADDLTRIIAYMSGFILIRVIAVRICRFRQKAERRPHEHHA